MTLWDRWQRGELLVFIAYLATAAMLWWGARYLYGEGSLWVALAGLLLMASLFAFSHLVDGVHPWFRQGVIFIGLGLSFPLLFRGAVTPFTLGSLLLGILLLEEAQWRALRLRHNLRSVQAFLVARTVLPAFFTAISLLVAAAVVLSPLGAKILENPLPQELVRKVFSFVKPPPILQQYQEYLRDPALRGQFGQIAGITLEEGDDYAALLSKLASRESRRLGDIHEDVFTLGFFFAAFGVMRVVALPFIWLSFLFVLFVGRVLKRLQLVSESEEPTVRTVVRWR